MYLNKNITRISGMDKSFSDLVVHWAFSPLCGCPALTISDITGAVSPHTKINTVAQWVTKVPSLVPVVFPGCPRLLGNHICPFNYKWSSSPPPFHKAKSPPLVKVTWINCILVIM